MTTAPQLPLHSQCTKMLDTLTFDVSVRFEQNVKQAKPKTHVHLGTTRLDNELMSKVCPWSDSNISPLGQLPERTVKVKFSDLLAIGYLPFLESNSAEDPAVTKSNSAATPAATDQIDLDYHQDCYAMVANDVHWTADGSIKGYCKEEVSIGQICCPEHHKPSVPYQKRLADFHADGSIIRRFMLFYLKLARNTWIARSYPYLTLETLTKTNMIVPDALTFDTIRFARDVLVAHGTYEALGSRANSCIVKLIEFGNPSAMTWAGLNDERKAHQLKWDDIRSFLSHVQLTDIQQCPTVDDSNYKRVVGGHTKRIRQLGVRWSSFVTNVLIPTAVLRSVQRDLFRSIKDTEDPILRRCAHMDLVLNNTKPWFGGFKETVVIPDPQKFSHWVDLGVHMAALVDYGVNHSQASARRSTLKMLRNANLDSALLAVWSRRDYALTRSKTRINTQVINSVLTPYLSQPHNHGNSATDSYDNRLPVARTLTFEDPLNNVPVVPVLSLPPLPKLCRGILDELSAIRRYLVRVKSQIATVTSAVHLDKEKLQQLQRYFLEGRLVSKILASGLISTNTPTKIVEVSHKYKRNRCSTAYQEYTGASARNMVAQLVVSCDTRSGAAWLNQFSFLPEPVEGSSSDNNSEDKEEDNNSEDKEEDSSSDLHRHASSQSSHESFSSDGNHESFSSDGDSASSESSALSSSSSSSSDSGSDFQLRRSSKYVPSRSDYYGGYAPDDIIDFENLTDQESNESDEHSSDDEIIKKIPSIADILEYRHSNRCAKDATSSSLSRSGRKSRQVIDFKAQEQAYQARLHRDWQRYKTKKHNTTRLKKTIERNELNKLPTNTKDPANHDRREKKMPAKVQPARRQLPAASILITNLVSSSSSESMDASQPHAYEPPHAYYEPPHAYEPVVKTHLSEGGSNLEFGSRTQPGVQKPTIIRPEAKWKAIEKSMARESKRQDGSIQTHREPKRQDSSIQTHATPSKSTCKRKRLEIITVPSGATELSDLKWHMYPFSQPPPTKKPKK